MAVRNTEKRLAAVSPLDPTKPLQPSELGQCAVAGRYTLVSYLHSPISQYSRNDYVLFVTGNLPPPESYVWTVESALTGEVLLREERTSGPFSWAPEHVGEYIVTVEVHDPRPSQRLQLHTR
jgi:hypothetical protein